MKITSFSQKIIISFLTVLLLMIALALVSYRAFIKMERLSEKLNRTLLLDMFLDESVSHHRKWMNDLAQTFLLNRKFQGSLNPHQCEFGKWYEAFEPPDRKSRQIYSRIDRPHHILHESAREILSLLYGSGHQRDIAHLMEVARSRYIVQMMGLGEVIEKKGEKPLSSLDGLLSLFNEIYQSFSASDQQGIAIVRSLQKLHQSLDSSLSQVYRLAQQGRWMEAKRFYDHEILPAHEEFLAHFARLDELVHQRVENNRKARQIYAQRTVPAMEELQELIEQLRSHFMNQVADLESEYYKVAKWSKNFILYSTLFIIFLTILYSFLIPQSLVKPIRQLTEFANRIATEGELSETIQLKNQDEIGQLASSFNRMIHALRKSQEELEEWGKKLEKKVNERTQALKSAYQQLEKAQAQLVQSSKLASIGELAAGMAHEINNPMNVIVGYSELLLDEIGPGTQTHAYVRGILEASQRISTIIRNLLTFARQGAQEQSQVSIPTLLDQALSFIERRLARDGIRIERDYEPGLPNICARGGQLGQVFLNLIINARDAILEKAGAAGEDFDKVLNIQARKIQKDQMATIQIRFRDSGVGIKPENISRVFDPFFTTKREGKGTGLGLSISYGIIKDHQGNIQVESREGEGTTFTIELPIILSKSDDSCSK